MDKDIFKKNINEKRYKYIVSFQPIGNYYIYSNQNKNDQNIYNKGLNTKKNE